MDAHVRMTVHKVKTAIGHTQKKKPQIWGVTHITIMPGHMQFSCTEIMAKRSRIIKSKVDRNKIPSFLPDLFYYFYNQSLLSAVC